MKMLFSTCIPSSIPLAISFFLLISLSLSASSQNAEKKICQTIECLAAAKNLRESMNFDVNPCDDFYKYACGNFSTVHSNFESTTDLTYVENAAEILNFLKQNNSNDEPEAVHKARKLFNLCKNKAAYKDNLDQIDSILQKTGLVGSFLDSDFDYTTALARTARLTGEYLYFTFGVIPNPYNQTVNTIALTIGSLESDSSPVEKLARLSKSKIAANSTMNEQDYAYEVTKRMCGNNTSTSCKRLLPLLNSTTNLKTEKNVKQKSKVSKIASEPNSSLNSSIPVIYTLKQLQDLTDEIAVEVNATIPTLNWTRYIEEIFIDVDNITVDLSDPNKVQITIIELDSFKDAIQLVHKIQNTTTIAHDLLSKVVYTLQNYVDSRAYYTTEQDCADLTTEIFSIAVSYVYTTKEKYIKTKAEIRTMFEHIRESFQQLIQNASWMDGKTKQRALQKLYSLKSFIAYPNIIKTPNFLDDFYRDEQITDNLYDTMIPIIQNQITKELKKINKINDPRKNEDWSISPTDVNAYYVSEKNTIVIPAGVLGFPFNNNGLYALDYGATGGSTLGHELSHAFDNTGRRYNEIGNIEDWWQPETANLYREKARCFVKAYGNYSLNINNNTLMVDSKKTLGEDLSDNVGFKESLLAYKKCVSITGEEPLLPQFENFNHEQLLTLAYANAWCTNSFSFSYEPELIKSDVHSIPEFRVNGVLQNSKEFSEIWKCPKGSKMNPSGDKCEVW